MTKTGLILIVGQVLRKFSRHPYVSVTGFVRPPYSKDTSKPSSTDTSSASKANDSTITGEAKKPQFKEVKTVNTLLTAMF